MRAYTVTFFMVNSRGTKLGSDPIVFRFYGPSAIDTCCLAFQRMCLDYGRSIGHVGSFVEIVSVDR